MMSALKMKICSTGIAALCLLYYVVWICRAGSDVHLRDAIVPWFTDQQDQQPPNGGSQGSNGTQVRAGPDMSKFKKILYWNDAYGDRSFFFGVGQEPFFRGKCRVNTCYATYNRSMFDLEDVDAVIWHLRANDKSFPPIRYPNTYYVFWMLESALYLYDNLNNYKNVFNWTLTYKTDSDFPRPYGRIIRMSSQPAPLPARNYAQGKTKQAAWFVSNCNTVSDRNALVRSLQKSVTVDIYGNCGPLKCSRKTMDQCYTMLDKDYKFYLSFENSLCYGYITEKFFGVLEHNVIPVVYGLGYDKLNMPPHSYIDVFNFTSVAKLAEYLLYLDRNDSAYNEYFRWKTEGYKVEYGFAMDASAYCDMCERLHSSDKANESSNIGMQLNRTSKENRRVYSDLNQWFVHDQCLTPQSNRLFANFIHGKDSIGTEEQGANSSRAAPHTILERLPHPNRQQ